jgi:hypothetical protein
VSEDMNSAPDALYVYHRVPPSLRGTVLYPLNQLAGVYPDLFHELRKNYATREDIAALRIPPLGNCLWNDVLHFSPVHPQRLKAALAEAGHELPSGWRRFFQVDARLLGKDETVIYAMQRAYYTGQFEIEAASEQIGQECLPFDAAALSRFTEVPEATRALYARSSAGSFPLFLFVPHVLYKGRLDVTQGGVSIIEV